MDGPQDDWEVPMPDACSNSHEQIASLVNAYRERGRAFRESPTAEATLRQEFLDPFFEALGWDIANRTHRSPAEKDVVVEAPVTTIDAERQHARRPDYLFRIGGFPRFVVEAKKPTVDLRTDRDAIFQAKSYAWSAQIPFAVLTNFESFRLFDATLKPYANEPQRGIVADFDLGYDDYVAQWDALLAVFGREAVKDGSLEQLLARIKHVRAGCRIRGVDRMLADLRGTEPVDRVFLAHLEDYRLRFAKTLFEENREEFKDVGTRHGAAKLTEATQRLIDRLVFVRVCEDRSICTWGLLRDALNDAADHRIDVGETLLTLFRDFDRQYNGYLFKPHFSERLKVAPSVLADFIRSLYPPDGPYRFDAIADDILGIIYERFLGSTIARSGRQIVAEQKPEVRHAGGVYYTPRFVVDSIIRRVIGPKLAGKAPSEVLNVRILDPACGSGSFLIAAYQYLMEHCIRYVSEHPDAAMGAPAGKRRGKERLAFQNGDGRWQLSPEFRARLLTECIFGVDIDAQAVEVTIMSLYLKLLEGKLPPGWQKELEFGRLLPPLDNNICCGNSLLSQVDFDDWWDETQGSLFAGDDDVQFRMNPFDWESDTRGFGRFLAKRPGFDCIVGNPPYVRVQELNKWAPDECAFYKWRYDSAAKGNYDIYVAFIERGLELLAPNGLLAFICPHKFWQATYGSALRKLIADGKHLRAVVDFADQQVFRGATTYTAIHVLGNGTPTKTVDYARVDKLEDGDDQCIAIDERRRVRGCIRFKTSLPRETEPWVFVDSNSPNGSSKSDKLVRRWLPFAERSPKVS
jgi:type I restriction-modification system DNA methylase subunit